MSHPRPVARRSLLLGASLVGVTAAQMAFTAKARAQPPSSLSSAAGQVVSLNGWPLQERANDVSTVWTRPVSGTGIAIPLALGTPQTLLHHVVRRVHYEIEALREGDLTGWRPLGATSRRSPASNISSGTAVRIRPGARTDAYFPFQEEVLRDILLDTDGAVRWGGDDDERDDSLFYLNLGPKAARDIGQRLRRANEAPGGIMPDSNIPSQRATARDLDRRQRKG